MNSKCNSINKMSPAKINLWPCQKYGIIVVLNSDSMTKYIMSFGEPRYAVKVYLLSNHSAHLLHT